MALHHKYRPEKVDDVWGNASTKRAVKVLLKKGKEDMPHALLFTGPSGCGKTTFGRIVAAELNCHGHDFQEVDTADFRGIETARGIRQKMRLRPSAQSDCRVWLLDECHKLTNDAQNALLKALEDTPSHVYFILCTTDPQKLLKTIKSRCTSFTVQALDKKEIVTGLDGICESEDKDVDKKILNKIAVSSQGHVRAAVVALDKVIDLPEKEQIQHLGKIEDEEAQTIELCRILMNRGSWKTCVRILDNLQTEPESVRYAVAGYARAVLTKSGKEDAFDLLNVFTSRKYIDQYELSAMCFAHIKQFGIWDIDPPV